MAAMTVALTEFSTSGNSRTSTLAGHTAVQPKLVIEKRKVPEGNQVMAEYNVKVVEATTNTASEILKEKVTAEVAFRYPVQGVTTERTAVLAALRAIVIGDEYGNSVETQEWL